MPKSLTGNNLFEHSVHFVNNNVDSIVSFVLSDWLSHHGVSGVLAATVDNKVTNPYTHVRMLFFFHERRQI